LGFSAAAAIPAKAPTASTTAPRAALYVKGILTGSSVTDSNQAAFGDRSLIPIVLLGE
jgi:hypothetical protein